MKLAGDVSKRCSRCGNTKPISAFHKCRKYGTQHWCKECRAAQARIRYQRRKQEYAEYRLFSRYGLSTAELEAILERQNHRCALCEERLADRKPHIDHDHDTGRVRGVLCSECNTGLGKLKDSPALLRRAIAYLEGR